MSNDVVLRSGKTLRLGDTVFELTGEPPVIVPDVLCEARQVNGLIYVSLASSTHHFGNTMSLEVCARMRMTVVAAQTLRSALDDMIEQALKPVDKTNAN